MGNLTKVFMGLFILVTIILVVVLVVSTIDRAKLTKKLDLAQKQLVLSKTQLAN